MTLPDVTWSKHFRSVGSINVHHVDLTADQRCEAAALAWLDASERRRAEQQRTTGQRREFAFCRSALRWLLCRQLGCANDQLAFAAQPGGKPFAVVRGSAHPLGFNVSHSGRHGLVAVAESGRLGVDVEERRQRADISGMAARMFAPEERETLARAAEDRQLFLFYRFWTMREAVMKALGSGLTLESSAFTLPLPLRCGAHSGLVMLGGPPRTRWRVFDLGTSHFAAALSCDQHLDSSAALSCYQQPASLDNLSTDGCRISSIPVAVSLPAAPSRTGRQGAAADAGVHGAQHP